MEMPAVMESNEDHSEESVKKDKKKKKKERKEVVEIASTENVEQSPADSGEKKKKKKKRKAEDQEAPVEVMDNNANGEAQDASERKKKKKKRKVAEENEKEVENNEDVEKPKKRAREEENGEQNGGEQANGEANDANGERKKKKKKKQGVRKDFYVEHELMKNFTQEEVEEYQRTHGIVVTGSDLKPIRTFEESTSTLTKSMLSVCTKFKNPTPIQSQCWPIILSGHDLVGIAETGSGKTIAFTLPALVHIKDQEPLSKTRKGPIVLILSPTRELAMQIEEVCAAAGKANDINSVCVYGGVSKDPQVKALKKGTHILVATPGRLLDLVNQKVCSLESVTYLVLDEADRMLDMGFEKDIKAIIGMIPTTRQTLMFSATWPQSIQAMAQNYQQNPVKVTIGSEDLSANHKVKQIVEVLDPYQKDFRLQEILQDYHKTRNNRILIFVLYKKEASRVENILRKKGWKVQSIHGDATQEQRTAAMKAFKEGTQPLLVATDVAARGLDIPNVEYVINYTFPLTVEDYVHRIGRTGRGGNTGISHTFFTIHDKSHAGSLVSVLTEANQEVPDDLKKFGVFTKKKEHAVYGAHFKDTSNKPMAKKAHIKFD